jgi:hypothetical protein
MWAATSPRQRRTNSTNNLQKSVNADDNLGSSRNNLESNNNSGSLGNSMA